ncbi:MAG: hypothetical protein JXA83_03975 [Acidimicrobiales bacterium]|nr:hypothetical protein [Acidimicrobiales bacterium]
MVDGAEVLFILIVRGILLWVLIPMSVLAWLVLAPARVVRRVVLGTRHPSLSAYVHWADDMLTFALERLITIGRPGRRDEIALVAPAWPTPSTDRRGDSLWLDTMEM